MPAATNPNIVEACRVDFIKGLRLADIATKYGLSLGGLKTISAKQGWLAMRTTLEQNRENIGLKVEDAVLSKMVDVSSERIKGHLERVFSTGSKFMEKLEANMLGAMSLPPILDAQTALSTIKSYQTADGLVRRSLGLADSVQEVQVSGQVDVAHTLSILSSCRSLVDQGKDKDVVVDVEALLIEAKDSESK